MLNRDEFSSNSRWLVAQSVEILAPLQRAAARLVVRRPPSAPSTWRRGLILGSYHIGDLLWRTHGLAPLAKGLPTCEWFCLTSPGTAEILDGNPALTAVLPYYSNSNWRLPLTHLSRLRGMQFDVALCSNRYRYEQELALALSVGIPNRVSYVHKGLRALVTHPIVVEQRLPFPAYFREFVAQLTGCTAVWPLRPVIFPTAAHRQRSGQFLAAAGFAPEKRLAVLVNTAVTSLNVLPDWLFVALARELSDRHGFAVLLAGGPGDRDYLQACASKAGGPIRVCAGDLSLLELAALLERAQVAVAPDSGPRHLANAAGTPVVFFPPLDRQHPVETGPYLDTELAVAEGVLARERAKLDAATRTAELVATVVRHAARKP